MHNNNTRKVNEMMAYSFIACTFVLLSLLWFNTIGIFSFNDRLLSLISVPGIPLTVLPLILFHLRVSDVFLKYFTAISFAIFIGILGSFSDIGINITFVLVPVASCLYFDRAYTLFCSFFCYIVMMIAIYFNSMTKFEAVYLGYTHKSIFIAYLLGFTLEYIIVIVCIYQILKRATKMVNDQHDAYLVFQAQAAKYQLILKSTNDVIFEYYPAEKKYTANHSIYLKEGELRKSINGSSIDDLIMRYPKLSILIDHLNQGFEQNSFEPFELDMSYNVSGHMVPLWFNCECFIVADNGKAVSVIGKLHDITRAKMFQQKNEQQIANLYRDPRRRNSLYEQVVADSINFTDADYGLLSKGHQVLAELMENIKYNGNITDAVYEMLHDVGVFFNLNRICVLETDMSSGTNTLSYQWSSDGIEHLENYFSHISRKDIRDIVKAYEVNGYLECNPAHGITLPSIVNPRVQDEAITGIILGNQLWIPTLFEGKYKGAIFFDRYDQTPYTTAEKFLLSEVANTLYTHIVSINSEKANKAKSDFLSTMSHEIRTPMNAIVGMTEVALREDMTSSLRKCLMTVKSSAFGLLTLINDILDFSKIEAGRFEIVHDDFSLLSVLNDVREITRARNNNKLTINFNIPDDLPTTLNSDAVRIKQVMINFISNAIKYTDEGSVDITIEVSRVDDTNATLSFFVADTGIGIKREDLPKLFKSYSQVDTTVNHHKEGTGLGLIISSQLIELMGGEVNVKSEYGKGSEFSFNVPVIIKNWAKAGDLDSFDYESDVDTISEDSDIITAPLAKVLVVDDTDLNLMIAQAIMAPSQMQIDLAESGAKALEMLENNVYDIIFMDHFMPEMDGVETTTRIRGLENNPNQNVPIIALTADAIVGVRETLISSGMNDYLSKPIVIKELNRVLRRHLPSDKL